MHADFTASRRIRTIAACRLQLRTHDCAPFVDDARNEQGFGGVDVAQDGDPALVEKEQLGRLAQSVGGAEKRLGRELPL